MPIYFLVYFLFFFSIELFHRHSSSRFTFIRWIYLSVQSPCHHYLTNSRSNVYSPRWCHRTVDYPSHLYLDLYTHKLPRIDKRFVICKPFPPYHNFNHFFCARVWIILSFHPRILRSNWHINLNLCTNISKLYCIQ